MYTPARHLLLLFMIGLPLMIAGCTRKKPPKLDQALVSYCYRGCQKLVACKLVKLDRKSCTTNCQKNVFQRQKHFKARFEQLKPYLDKSCSAFREAHVQAGRTIPESDELRLVNLPSWPYRKPAHAVLTLFVTSDSINASGMQPIRTGRSAEMLQTLTNSLIKKRRLEPKQAGAVLGLVIDRRVRFGLLALIVRAARKAGYTSLQCVVRVDWLNRVVPFGLTAPESGLKQLRLRLDRQGITLNFDAQQKRISGTSLELIHRIAPKRTLILSADNDLPFSRVLQLRERLACSRSASRPATCKPLTGPFLLADEPKRPGP